ncbi:DksA/TraR family C4-type zinc finger protein [Paracoccus sp. p4-l81]|uniref:DksA/TraR family C4-type zinc finger protein n=1 Tax=unclassified Paracoccus (in: a-proteobacteria) TaxID=2688777 RepID=UPI0035BA097E
MAGGWARDEAVSDQIETSIAEALARQRARRGAQAGEGLAECAECGDEIPPARRQAVPGVRLCIACQGARDRSFRPVGGINRRGSKDSQLK